MPGEIFRYIAGHARLKVIGLSIEKFINRAQSSDIILLDIKRNKYREVTFRVNRYDTEKVKKIAEQLGLEVEIIKESGLLYYLQCFLKHRSFASGMLIFILLLYLSTSFVWAVEIKGNEEIATEELEEIVEELGVKPGVLKSVIDHDRFILELLNREKRLSWAEIEIKGVKARISVAEGKGPPEIIDYSVPCNIVAEKDGFLVKLLPLNGEKAVEDGNAVKKGQVLVSGIVYSELSGTRFVHALGQAWAHTYYTGEAEVNINDYLYKETGNYAVRHELLINDLAIPMYIDNNDIGFEKYSVTIEDVLPARLTDYIPVGLHKVIYRELIEKDFNDALKIAKEKSEEQAFQKAQEGIPPDGKILQKMAESNMTPQGHMSSKVVVEVLEDIAMEEEVIISEEDEFGK
ncbi:MAG: sporulation protein YqfD [Thermoanaerobacteraceae bacterium]|nr:sporulation protein YqfD [Thermoanaerobacteraceae bacterium]